MSKVILERLAHIQMILAGDDFDRAAEWYTKHLGFKFEWRHKNSRMMLSLPDGTELLFQCGSNTFPLAMQPGALKDGGNPLPPFVFRAFDDAQGLRDDLESSGARILEFTDEGSSYVLACVDPFGHVWTIMCPKEQ